MADRFKPPDMDWSSPGDMHKRFKIFKQKCELIFDGPLEDLAEDKKSRMLLLWAGDKGLEIYNAATWDEEGDKLKIKPVMSVLEAYTKPQSNQILARYQLRCLKQGDMSIEEFVIKACLLIEDGGYISAVRDSTLRDTLVFDVKSDKVRKDSIALGNTLTFRQVYDLAKIDESTKAQMEIISHGENKSELHTLQRRMGKTESLSSHHSRDEQDVKPGISASRSASKKPSRFQFKFKGCFRCGNNHDKSRKCPARNTNCNHCGKVGHYARVCMKHRLQKVHSIVNSPGYEGQDIYLEEDDRSEGPYNVLHHNEEDSSDVEPINVFLGTVTSNENEIPQRKRLHDFSTHPEKIYVTVSINDLHDIRLKVDTGADACVITTGDLQNFPFPIDILPCSSILKGYGGSEIENIGLAMLKVSYKGKSTSITFNIVEAPGRPSMLGCPQCQELGIITANIDEMKTTPLDPSSLSTKPPVAHVSTTGNPIKKSTILKEYQDCFDKLGRFPGDKYHIQLIDNPVPVIHAPRTVPVHILPLYKAELDKMIADDVITKVEEPTEWVNSIVCNIKETPSGEKRVRLCLDPKDLNKNIRREHYYTRNIDELLPLLHGKKFFSVVDTKKGYWHVELDDDSSFLCTFNTPFGRYRFKRLPFGVILSQDIFQRKLDEVYNGIANVTGIADDIVVCGSTESEHDRAFIEMLEATRRHNVSLNSEKLQFKQSKVSFFGHTLTDKGIQPAEDKLEAIRNIKTPANVKELQTLLGMVTYLNRYSSKLASLTAPLREQNKERIKRHANPHVLRRFPQECLKSVN